MRYFKVLFPVLIVFFFTVAARAQTADLKYVPGLSSNEIYDLLVDHRGFLWIGHTMGLSMYDGVTFTNFSQKNESSLAISDLLEDSHGRIWGHNFSGQIFYVENGEMKLLKAYAGEHEIAFPRIGLCKNLVVATTSRGLFVCNTDNLECRYLTGKNLHGNGTVTLSVNNSHAIGYGHGRWFQYKPGGQLQSLVADFPDSLLLYNNVVSLAPKMLNDTAFMFLNPANLLFKFVVKNNRLCEVGKTAYPAFINTISVTDKDYRVNTLMGSYASHGHLVDSSSLSSMITDREGNHWYGGLQYGLLTDATGIGNVQALSYNFSKKKLLACVKADNGEILLGTQNGELWQYNVTSHAFKNLFILYSEQGAINYLHRINDSHIIVGASVQAYDFNTKTHELKKLNAIRSLKQVCETGGTYLMASSDGLLAVSFAGAKVSDTLARIIKRNSVENFIGSTDSDTYNQLSKQRCRAVCYMPGLKTIFASFKDGLYRINAAGSSPFIYQQQVVHATSLSVWHNTLVVGTFNNGLLFVDGNKIKQLTMVNGLLSNSIIDVKVTGDHLWLYGNGSVQIIDMHTLQFIYTYRFPNIKNAFIVKLDELNGTCYYSTLNGFFSVSQQKPAVSATNICLLSLSANEKNIPVVPHMVLAYTQNNIQFNLGIPLCSNAEDIAVNYRLYNGQPTPWIVSKPGERNLRFVSLTPGTYTFEAYAINPNGGFLHNNLKYTFTIQPPWWQTWKFYLLCLALFTTLLITGIRTYYANRLREQKIHYEREIAVRNERQRISNEMHDDIGAGLSAIKLYVSTLNPTDDVGRVRKMIADLTTTIREVIWSLNSEYDTLENLLYFIETGSKALFEHSDTRLHVILPDDIPEVTLNGLVRRSIYLMVKEALHNVIKHAQAKNTTLNMQITDENLVIEVQDDGVGFNTSKPQKSHGQGLKSIGHRTKQLKGSVSIKPGPPATITFTLPVRLIRSQIADGIPVDI